LTDVSMTEDVGNNGERMNADANDWYYYAHLSIYHFATEFITGRDVLDAGSGSGYGSAYLAKHGAKSVEACDASSEAVEFSKRRYANSGVNYQTLDLCGELRYADHSFDVIFSSNVMEHLIEIDHFIDECRRIIQPGGKFLIAVPPIPSKELLIVNIKNEFHVTNLTPRGWYSKISRFFENVACH
jgi:2-polyprenyl-3-methyl-5-hydroxy-6-metoxy-1,4-benzoquinol methylase